MTKPTLLVVDDDEDIRTQMKWALAGDYEVALAGDRMAAAAAFSEARPTVTLLDLGLPPSPNSPEEGLATLSGLLVLDRLAKVIVVSGQGDRENALRAVGAGAYDFLCKPVDMDELKLVLKRCVYVAELERDYRALQEQARPDAFEDMLGASARMQAVFDFVRKAATTSAPILILGENGTGKEMVARALHRRSRQRTGPFVPINCNAIPENLLESELFGFEKGAFTGAAHRRVGKIEQAHGGTVFLDEIGDMPFGIQSKILRLLQEKSIERLGGRDTIPVDVRIIAATNRDLEAALQQGRFREDLYYRLKVVTIVLPPLRERVEDIPLLVDYFLTRYAAELDMSNPGIAKDALGILRSHSWPGNVRELANAIQKALIFNRGAPIQPQDILQAAAAGTGAPSAASLRDTDEVLRQWVRETIATRPDANKFDTVMDHFASILIGEALNVTRGNRSQAARLLGLSRPTLHSKIEKYRLKLKTSVEGDPAD